MREVNNSTGKCRQIQRGQEIIGQTRREFCQQVGRRFYGATTSKSFSVANSEQCAPPHSTTSSCELSWEKSPVMTFRPVNDAKVSGWMNSLRRLQVITTCTSWPRCLSARTSSAAFVRRDAPAHPDNDPHCCGPALLGGG